jgi:hypothetical protein
MIEFAAKEGERRYSNDLYMAIVILFGSRSTYDPLRSFIPLPSIPAVCHHFQATVKTSLARFESVDGVVPYLCRGANEIMDDVKEYLAGNGRGSLRWGFVARAKEQLWKMPTKEPIGFHTSFRLG